MRSGKFCFSGNYYLLGLAFMYLIGTAKIDQIYFHKYLDLFVYKIKFVDTLLWDTDFQVCIKKSIDVNSFVTTLCQFYSLSRKMLLVWQMPQEMLSIVVRMRSCFFPAAFIQIKLWISLILFPHCLPKMRSFAFPFTFWMG